jgi:uncharacterized protein (DUF488 family)
MNARLTVWTVGHSNHEFDAFARLLTQERIEFLIDVRSFPYSRFASHFNRDELQQRIRQLGIGYLFLGEELGGRPTSDDHYDEDGHALYAAMSREPAFRGAIDRVLEGAGTHRLALVCSEGDPHDCHRRLLVGRVLAERGAQLRHILPDGTVRVEDAVDLRGVSSQCSLFAAQAPWRSTRSVSHRRRLSTSSHGPQLLSA